MRRNTTESRYNCLSDFQLVLLITEYLAPVFDLEGLRKDWLMPATELPSVNKVLAYLLYFQNLLAYFIVLEF